MEFFKKTALAALVMGFSGAALAPLPAVVIPRQNLTTRQAR